MRLLPTLLALAVAAGAVAVPPASAASAARQTTAAPSVATAPAASAAPGTIAAPGVATARSDDAGILSVDIVPRQDGTLVAGSDLTLALRLENGTDAEVPEGTATVTLARTPVDSREKLDAWLLDTGDTDAGLSEFRGTGILQLATPEVGAGGSVVLADAVVPAASLPFTAERAGVYLLSVAVSAGDGAPVVARSAVTVRGATSPPSARIAFAAPITVPPGVGGLISADELESYTVPGGLLDRQLSEASGQPVTIAIDPRVIASVRALGDTAPASALDWLERLAVVPNDTFALAYADSDISATSQAAGVVLAPTSVALNASRFDSPTGTEPAGTPTPSPTPTAVGRIPTLDDLLAWDYSIAGIAWPVDDSVVAADLDTFAASGLQTTIVSSSNVSFPQNGAPPASGTTGGHRVVSSDDTVSTLLREAVAAPTLAQWQADVARLSAALAGVAEQTGAADRVVLATLGRSVPGSEFRLSSTIAAVTGSGLAITSAFSDAISRPPADAAIVDSPQPPDRLARFAALFASEGATAQFATVLEDPTPITGERRLSLMDVASQSWAADPEGWSAAADGYLRRGAEILSSVVVASTNLVQTSDRNPLPIVVTNALDYPVTVTVEVTSLRPIVRIADPSVDVTVPANSQKRASIAAESIANGEVSLSISLFSRTRVPVSAPSIIEVTVSAGWETTATGILAVLVVAVFVLGIVRTVRRRRRIARGEQEDDRQPYVSDLNDSVVGRAAAGGDVSGRDASDRDASGRDASGRDG